MHFSCTFLGYEDQKLHIWPKQGCRKITGRTRKPPAVHRLQNSSIGTIFCRPAKYIADRPKVPESGADLTFHLGSFKIGFQTLFPYSSLAEILPSLSLECFPLLVSSFSLRFTPVSSSDSRFPSRFGRFHPNKSLFRYLLCHFHLFGVCSPHFPLDFRAFFTSRLSRPFSTLPGVDFSVDFPYSSPIFIFRPFSHHS